MGEKDEKCPYVLFILSIFDCLGLRCRVGFSPVVMSGQCTGCLVAVRGLLIAVDSLVVEQEFWGMWASVVASHGIAQ